MSGRREYLASPLTVAQSKGQAVITNEFKVHDKTGGDFAFCTRQGDKVTLSEGMRLSL